VEEWLSTCYLPDHTELQERTLKTTRSMVVGTGASSTTASRGRHHRLRVLHRERDVVAEHDIRIDNFCEVNGDVVAGRRLHREGVKINGKLVVRGDSTSATTFTSRRAWTRGAGSRSGSHAG